VFEWLSEELASIRTPRFHIVDGPANAKLRDAVAHTSLELPASYRKFVLKFGNAKLYRQSREGYTVGVFAGPRSAKPRDGISMYQIGWDDDAAVYACCGDSSVYRGGREKPRKGADDFCMWLVAACNAARRAYSPAKWAEILRGPVPFSQEEELVVATRRRFEWRVLRVDPSGHRVIEVKNGGNIPLPVFTIGVRSKDGRLNGAVLLKVSHVHPGRTAVLHADCYKDLVRPEETELFSLPDPQPEDREYYAEFGAG
jgi:hypothetical protein